MGRVRWCLGDGCCAWVMRVFVLSLQYEMECCGTRDVGSSGS